MEIITGIIGLIYVSLAWLFSSIGDNRMGLAALIIMMLLLGSQAVLDAIFQELYRKRNVIQHRCRRAASDLEIIANEVRHHRDERDGERLRACYE